jgi:hypothetical protein
MGDVGDRAVLDHHPALQLEIALVEQLVRTLAIASIARGSPPDPSGSTGELVFIGTSGRIESTSQKPRDYWRR